MAKAGRKRKQVKRTPSGAPSRAGQRRDPRLTALDQPHRRAVPPEKRSSQAAATSLGQAWLLGLLTPDSGEDRQEIANARYEAGQRWGSLVGQMFDALAAPVRVGSTLGQIVAPGIEEPDGLDSAGEPESDEDRCDRILGVRDEIAERRSGGQYDRAMQAITRAVARESGAGEVSPADWWVFGALDLVIVREQSVTACPGTLEALLFGLDALVRHWHLGAPPQRMRSAMADGARPVSGIINPAA